MRFCQPHWDQLRDAVQQKGMLHLCARTGEEAASRMAAQLKTEPSAYDPLIACHWQIVNKALEAGGLYLMGEKEGGGQYCPLCELVANIKVTEEDTSQCTCPGGFTTIASCWIEGCTDAALEHCKELGLELKPYETIRIFYLCGLCDLEEIGVDVEVRQPDEDVKAWVDRSASRCVTDHHRRRPACVPKKFKHLKIPVPKDDGRNIGTV